MDIMSFTAGALASELLVEHVRRALVTVSEARPDSIATLPKRGWCQLWKNGVRDTEDELLEVWARILAEQATEMRTYTAGRPCKCSESAHTRYWRNSRCCVSSRGASADVPPSWGWIRETKATRGTTRKVRRVHELRGGARSLLRAQGTSLREMRAGADDPPRERAGPVSEPAVPARSAALPMCGATSAGGAAARQDQRAVLGMPATAWTGAARRRGGGKRRTNSGTSGDDSVDVERARRAGRTTAESRGADGHPGRMRRLTHACRPSDSSRIDRTSRCCATPRACASRPHRDGSRCRCHAGASSR